VAGSELVGLRYTGPFDELAPAADVEHRVIPWDDVSLEEGTGIVHIAPGAGQEDFELGRIHDLPVLSPVDLTYMRVDPVAPGRFRLFVRSYDEPTKGAPLRDLRRAAFERTTAQDIAVVKKVHRGLHAAGLPASETLWKESARSIPL